MKRFNENKTLKSFEDSKLTKSQMDLTRGGLRIIIIIIRGTSGTASVCHVDGTTDADSVKG